jgi:peptidyl-tRNA hydrolase, PTH2 family
MPIEPNPFDDERLAQVRAEQGDPIVQYFIVRSEFEMSTGKIGAQIAHGAEMFVLRYNQYANLQVSMSEDECAREEITRAWLNGSFRKVVLRGKKKDFEKIIAELPVFLVRDAGLTEVEPNSETVLVTWPMRKSDAPKCISRLQAL